MGKWNIQLCLTIVFGIKLSFGGHFREDASTLCAHHKVKCPPGRECRLPPDTGVPQCFCVSSCPIQEGSSFLTIPENVICGSDGLVYPNICELQRAACLRGIHIESLPKSECNPEPLRVLSDLLEHQMEQLERMIRSDEDVSVPDACHQNERNRMREFLISWMAFNDDQRKNSNKEKSQNRFISDHFEESDIDKDGFLDSFEWLAYIQRKPNDDAVHGQSGEKENQEDVLTNPAKLRLDEKVNKQRLLCLDALVEEADKDRDWRLNRTEFQELMDQDYIPSNKYCIMDRKKYEDGFKTKVDCNGCVCACGKWICTSKLCGRLKLVNKKTQFRDEFLYGDEEDDAFADMLRSGERSPNSGFTNLGLDYEDADNLPD